MMMTVDEKLHAYAKNQKDRNIDEKKLQQTIIKSKEAYWDGEIERNMSWLEFLYQQASYIQKHWWFAQGAVLLILWMTMFYKVLHGDFGTEFCNIDTSGTLEK